MIHSVKHLPRVISIGVQTETGVEPVGFDLRAWLDVWEDIKVTVCPTRPGEDAAYPAANTELVGTVLYWYPNEADTAIPGTGKVELLGLTKDKRKLSGWCETNVQPTSLAVTQEVPEAARPWVDEVLDAAKHIKESIVNVPYISDHGTWMMWDAAAGEYVDSGTSAKGKDGQDGYTPIKGKDYTDGKDGHDGISPVVELTETADGVDISVADVGGEKTATVKHGKDGRDGKDGLDGKDGRDGIDGQDGDTRVYVGSDEPPEDAEVWIDPEGAVSGRDLPEATETERGAVILDSYLTKSGAAADAKTVGDKFTALTEEIAKLPSGGGGAAIVDVEALPETDIREDVFYRVLTAEYWYNEAPATVYTCHVVETLPDVGEPATDATMSAIVSYYAADTGENSGYLTAELGAAFGGLPAGWYPAAALLQAAGVAYGGIVGSLDEMQSAETMYLYLQESLKYRNNDAWDNVQSIGWGGTGIAAEIFNTPLNIAYGNYSHAEGRETTASGNYSHVEGRETTASGDYSHAEGYKTTASGDYSHAEGHETTASGDFSHAEGNNTTASANFSHAEGLGTTASGEHSHAEGSASKASGKNSHAEGNATIAASDYQHVQGKNNIEDASGKYAHIVGNGEYSNKRSNAHTLDWDGNAWFAGGIELTSPNGTRYRFTVSDDGTLTATAVTE